MKIGKQLCVGAAFAFLALAGGAPAFAQMTTLAPGAEAGEAARHGAELAKLNCARCHSVEIEGPSPHPEAPAFWEMSERRSVESIAEMLLTQTSPKHSDMPTFEITQKQANDLAAWISWVQPVAHGRRLVSENCAACHAIGLEDESTHPEAPAFRTLSQKYPIEALEEAFAEGIETGHPDMPVFDADMIQIEDILAYLQSIQVK